MSRPTPSSLDFSCFCCSSSFLCNNWKFKWTLYLRKKWSTLKRDLPERDEVGVAEDWAEEGEQVLPHLCVSFHVPPPDLWQQTLEEGRKCHHRWGKIALLKAMKSFLQCKLTTKSITCIRWNELNTGGHSEMLLFTLRDNVPAPHHGWRKAVHRRSCPSGGRWCRPKRETSGSAGWRSGSRRSGNTCWRRLVGRTGRCRQIQTVGQFPFRKHLNVWAPHAG